MSQVLKEFTNSIICHGFNHWHLSIEDTMGKYSQDWAKEEFALPTYSDSLLSNTNMNTWTVSEESNLR